MCVDCSKNCTDSIRSMNMIWCILWKYRHHWHDWHIDVCVILIVFICGSCALRCDLNLYYNKQYLYTFLENKNERHLCVTCMSLIIYCRCSGKHLHGCLVNLLKDKTIWTDTCCTAMSDQQNNKYPLSHKEEEKKNVEIKLEPNIVLAPFT